MHGVQLDEHDAGRAKPHRPPQPAGGEPSHGGAASLLTLQRAAGNRAVASMLGGVHRTVQRCGPGSDCGCSPEEQAQHAPAESPGGGPTVHRSADQPDHRHGDELSG